MKLYILCALGITLVLGCCTKRALADDTIPEQWQVQPKACIVQKLGDTCEIDIYISLPSLAYGQYCYYQDRDLLTCFDAQKPITQLTLRFMQESQLSLQNQENIVLYQQELIIKTRETKKKVRRAREPWSLF